MITREGYLIIGVVFLAAGPVVLGHIPDDVPVGSAEAAQSPHEETTL
ncbi:MAG: hypothetical protein ACR2GR_02300 [Rhodothermales bacterium]